MLISLSQRLIKDWKAEVVASEPFRCLFQPSELLVPTEEAILPKPASRELPFVSPRLTSSALAAATGNYYRRRDSSGIWVHFDVITTMELKNNFGFSI